MAVAHGDSCYTGKQVQITPPIHIPQPLHVSLMEEHWSLEVRNLHGYGVAVVPANLHHTLFGHTLY